MRKTNSTEATPEVASIDPSDLKGLMKRFISHVKSALRSSVTYTNACQTAAEDLVALRLAGTYEGREEKTINVKGEPRVIKAIPAGIDYAGKSKQWTEQSTLYWEVALGKRNADGTLNEDPSADEVAKWCAATHKAPSHFPVRKNVEKMFTASLKLRMVEDGVDPNLYGFKLSEANDSPVLINKARAAGYAVEAKAERAPATTTEDNSEAEADSPERPESIKLPSDALGAAETALTMLNGITDLPTDLAKLARLMVVLQDVERRAEALLTTMGVYSPAEVSA